MSSIRLTMPEPKINLYEDGFEGKCKLGRKATGDRLSELVERIDEPLVIALDGAWGSGKSVFLKCWVGEHSKNENYTAQTIYFDAFEHDYIDEPLIGLSSAIFDRLPNDAAGKRFLRKGKKVLTKLALPALRVGGAALTGGATELTGAAADAAINAGWKETEKAAEAYWKHEASKSAAMEQFRSALTELTHSKDGEAPTQKLIIVIDELDRCRPDYALSLLEIIKHFFAVPGVHFILGANISELKNSIRARYGNGVNADIYLQKFISLSMSLPTKTEIRKVEEVFWGQLGGELGMNEELWETALQVIKACKDQQLISLRSLQRFASNLMLLPQNPMLFGDQFLLVSAAFLKVHAPKKYLDLRNGTLSFGALTDVFKRDNFDYSAVWIEGIDPSLHDDTTKQIIQGIFAHHSYNGGQNLMSHLANRFLETFSFPAQPNG